MHLLFFLFNIYILCYLFDSDFNLICYRWVVKNLSFRRWMHAGWKIQELEGRKNCGIEKGALGAIIVILFLCTQFDARILNLRILKITKLNKFYLKNY